MRSRDAGDRSARPPILRSIRTRLAATFFLVTALSVAVIYIVVAPPLTCSGVQIGPGATPLTRMPLGASCLASDLT